MVLRLASSVFLSASFFSGLVRDVPRMVPPRVRIPETESKVSGAASAVSIPLQPSFTPKTLYPSCPARHTTARITGLSPGQSPPPVRIPIVPVELFPISIFHSLNGQMNRSLGVILKQPARRRHIGSKAN